MRPSTFATLKRWLYTPVRLASPRGSSRSSLLTHHGFPQLSKPPRTPAMVRFLLKKRIVRGERRAVILLIGISLACWSLVAAILILRHHRSDVVIDRCGNAYTAEQYLGLVRLGKDPLLTEGC